ncbi:MAG TPA: ABC transporter permease [Euzebya sp.]|nr:ABC transporter permease [Euzebya sp.]
MRSPLRSPAQVEGPQGFLPHWLTEPSLSPDALVDGAAPTGPNQVAIDTASATAAGLEIGDTTVVRTPAPAEVIIVGLLEPRGGAAGGLTITAFDFEAAQHHLLGREDQVTRILLAGDGLSQDQLAERIAPLLPAGAEAITGADLTDEALEGLQADFLGFFEAFLLVFAAIALLVATFSIYNTFSITIAQRLRESALLRALGASRRQVLTSTLLEGALVGALASALGLGAGIGLASGLQALMSVLGFGLERSPLVVDWVTVAMAFGVGLTVTILASLLPAVRASRIAPLAALRDVAVDRTGTSSWRVGGGAMLATAGVALAVLAGSSADNALPLAAVGAVLSWVGVVVLAPTLAGPFSAAAGAAVHRMRGLTGALAQRNVARNPRRTAGTAAALMIGVGVVSLFTVVAGSIKATIDDSVATSFGGDLVVMSSGFSGSGLAPELLTDLRDLPVVQEAAGIGLGAGLIDGEERVFTVTRPEVLQRLLELPVSAGSLSDVGVGQIAVAGDTAEEEGWTIGSAVDVRFAAGGTETLEVAAIYDASAGDSVSTMLLSSELYDMHAVQVAYLNVLVDLAEGIPLEAGRTAVEGAVAAHGAPRVLDRDGYAQAAAEDVDQLLAIVYVLLALAIVIALMGITNTLALSVHERTSEIGLLRAVGQTRRQVRSMIRWESVIVALFGTTTGIALGTFLGWTFIRAIAAQEGFGVFAAPLGQLSLVLLLGAVVGIVAAVRPARGAARMDVLAAIATE